MIRAYRTEINPTEEQKIKINRTLGVCRFVYNLYIAYNLKAHEEQAPFITGVDFSKYLNHVYLKNNPDKTWIKDVSSKAVKQAILNAHRAFAKFFAMNKKPGYKPYSKNQIQYAQRTGNILGRYEM